MTIRDLMENFTIQGRYVVKQWNNEEEIYKVVATGFSFENEIWQYDEVLDYDITYMYCQDDELIIEIAISEE